MKLFILLILICSSLLIGFTSGIHYAKLNNVCTIQVSDVNHRVSYITKECIE
jgi:hypothetical protein